MNNIKKVAATLSVFALLPFASLAQGNDNNGNQDKNFIKVERDENDSNNNGVGNFVKSFLHRGSNDSKENSSESQQGNPQQNHRKINGLITSLTSTGFSVKTKDGKVFTVNVSGATITSIYGTNLQLSGIKINDQASIKGTTTGDQVNAERIVVTPANTHTASAAGTVSTISGNTITVQAEHMGITYPITVVTNASTTVVQNGRATSTGAIAVGSMISVKGLWNELVNVLNAIKIMVK